MQDHCSRSPQGDGQIPAARTVRGLIVSADIRDAIHPELMIALSVVGDIWISQGQGAHLEAASRARELRDVTRLLDDFGWDPEGGDASEYEITLGAAGLTRAVGRSQLRTAAALEEEILEARASEQPYRDSLRAIAAYGPVLRLLGEGATPAALVRGEEV